MGALKKLLKGSKKEDTAASGNPSGDGASCSYQEEPVFHADAAAEGGLAFTNDELLKQQREAIMTWVKSMGKRLLTGNINLINTPFPVTIFEPRSYLEKLSDVWVYPRYLTAAAQTSHPVERLKLVVVWFIAGLHHAFENWRKPFNPILGETWQATLSDGTAMFMEQISHHPPVTAFHMEGPGSSYTFRGLSQPTVSIVVKYYGFKTVAKGFRHLEFPDGTLIEIHYPQYCIKDVVYGSRPRAEVDGQAILVDPKNKLKAVLNFGALKGAKNKLLRRNDAVHGFIYDCRNNQSSLMERASTADIATEAPSRQETQGDDDEEGEQFESASENEWDPSKEEAEQAEVQALAQAAAEAAAVAEAEAAEAAIPSTSANGAGSELSSLRVSSVNGVATAAAAERSSAMTTSYSHDSSPHASARDKASSSSFFGLSIGKLMRLAPSASPPLPTTPIANEAEGAVVCSLEGSWLSHVDVSGTRYWSIAKERPDRWTPVPDALPSDCRYRHDLVELAQGDLKAAQKAKELLEEKQRADKRIRAAATGSKH